LSKSCQKVVKKLSKNVKKLSKLSKIIKNVVAIDKSQNKVNHPAEGAELCDDYTQCLSFRLISLMPFLLKTLERMVLGGMEEQSTPFHRDQHAFRKGHSTKNALSHLVDTAKKAILHRNVLLAVFLDIKGAFDNLTTESIEDVMNSHGEEEELTGWFCNHLNGRYCQVKGNKQYFRLRKGTGQGGVLSPTIWNFVMDSFLTTFTDHEADAIAYANDGALIIVAKNRVGGITHAKRNQQSPPTKHD
jgi:hypothetical protein